MWRQETKLAAVIVAAVGLFAVLILSSRESQPAHDPMLKRAIWLTTDAWQEHGRLLLRSTSPESADLLLKDLTLAEAIDRDYNQPAPAAQAALQPTVYRYVSGARQLEALPREAWQQATGDICDCDFQPQIIPMGFQFDDVAHSLTLRDQAVATAGPWVFGVAASPSGRYLAVGSADGKLRDHRIGFFAGFDATGEPWHQVLRTKDATPVGASILLPYTIRKAMIRPCWSPDERFVVYPDGSAAKVCIVETGLASNERPQDAGSVRASSARTTEVARLKK